MTERLEGRRAQALMGVVFAATVLISLNATMLSIALPRVAGDLHAGALQANWMVLAYMVVNGATLVLTGQLADVLDLRRLFLAGLVVFVATSVGLASSTRPWQFIAARAVQGVGSALLLATSAAMLAVAFRGPQLTRAMGIYLAGFAIAQVSGPTVGGLLTAHVGWRWMFLLAVPIGLGALVVGYGALRHLPPSVPTRKRWREAVDVPGNALLVLMITAALVGLSAAQRGGWLSATTLLPLALAGLLLAPFVVVEHRHASPAVAVDLLRDRDFALANLAGMLLAVPRMVPTIVLSLWFQGLGGLSPTTAALRITPLAAGVAVGSLVAGRLRATRDAGRVALLCAVATLGGSALFTVALWLEAVPVLLVSLAVIGIATGLFSTLNATAIMTMRPPSRAGNVNGIRTMAQTVGLSAGTALMLSLAVGGLGPSTAGSFLAGRREDLTSADVAQLSTNHVVVGIVLILLTAVAAAAQAVVARRRA